MSRSLWFVAGAGAGVYALVKARHVAEVFTPEGLRHRMAGLEVGAQLFAQEVRTGMSEKEAELRERLGWVLEGPRELLPGDAVPGPSPEAQTLRQPTQETS